MAAGSSGAPWMPKPGDDYSYNQFSAYGDANAAGAYYQVGRWHGGQARECWSLAVRESFEPVIGLSGIT